MADKTKSSTWRAPKETAQGAAYRLEDLWSEQRRRVIVDWWRKRRHEKKPSETLIGAVYGEIWRHGHHIDAARAKTLIRRRGEMAALDRALREPTLAFLANPYPLLKSTVRKLLTEELVAGHRWTMLNAEPDPAGKGSAEWLRLLAASRSYLVLGLHLLGLRRKEIVNIIGDDPKGISERQVDRIIKADPDTAGMLPKGRGAP